MLSVFGLVFFCIVFFLVYAKVNDVFPFYTVATPASVATSTIPAPVVVPNNSLNYRNTNYGFSLTLPAEFKGYSIIETSIPFGHEVIIRNPFWTGEHTYMDIPILIYDIKTYDAWIANHFEGYPTAAPIGPTERGRNSMYVFATAPRYNYSFATGFEKVEESIKTLKGFEINSTIGVK